MDTTLSFIVNHIPDLLCLLWAGFTVLVALEDKAYQKLTLSGIIGLILIILFPALVLTIERLNVF